MGNNNEHKNEKKTMNIKPQRKYKFKLKHKLT